MKQHATITDYEKQTTQSRIVMVQSASVRWSRAQSFQWRTAVNYFRRTEKLTPRYYINASMRVQN